MPMHDDILNHIITTGGEASKRLRVTVLFELVLATNGMLKLVLHNQSYSHCTLNGQEMFTHELPKDVSSGFLTC